MANAATNKEASRKKVAREKKSCGCGCMPKKPTR